ncbi:MAG: serine hydrolase [Gemmatimonadaceae bacterium]|nr:serine hydrolase [Gemmatimonadaceae bacterium]
MHRYPLRALYIAAAASFLVAPASVHAQSAPYFPPAGSWERRAPAQVGLSAMAVDSAVALALANESTTPRDMLEAHRISFGREPFGEAIGPFRARAGAAGLIIRHGYIVAAWGDPNRVDHTFSVTKSFVTTTIGLAFDRKMIRAVTDPVRQYMAPIIALKGPPGAGAPLVRIPPTSMNGLDTLRGVRPTVAYDAFEVLEPFESEHNRTITWEHLLRQTSDWQGTLWGKPDWADRFPRNTTDTAAVINRKRDEAGTVYKYNDVRVNLMALAALNIWRRPLPQVLKEYVMDPIGASDTWRWLGYDNSWVLMDGALVQSVAGGGHWGGGMLISAYDMARFGLLTLHAGKWRDKQLVSERWIRMSRSPGPANDQYGFANYFLNTGRKALPSAPEQVFYHLGNGNNIIYVDPVNDLVIVARWMNSTRTLDSMVKLLTPRG